MVTKKRGMDRREFLRWSSLTAAGTLLAACSGGGGSSSTGGSSSGSETSGGLAASSTDIKYAKGLTYSGKYREAPALAALVKQGKLPPVEQRLPQHPYVVPHDWVTEGKYGGTMRWVCSDATDGATGVNVQESMYGHSPVRWLKDGQEVGPGLAESWDASKDLTTWTYHFRKGLRWSDGAPWTVDDILFWWQDVVGETALHTTAPQELRSGKGTAVQMVKIDDYTLQLKYDSPTPLAVDQAARSVKRGQGAGWMEPKHYLSQFHAKYNKSVDPTNWPQQFLDKANWWKNPDSPTMTGWRLKEYKQGQFSMWERNPYYYAIDRWGKQLPYMDGLTNANVQDPQAMRLEIQQGKVDYVNGFHVGLALSDVSTIKNTQSQNDLTLLLWDSGNGTGSAWFFNQDHQDEKLRNLFRNAKFRQAMSLAFNRANARKLIYYNQGEATTGTMSPKAAEFNVGQGSQVYKQWRDAFVEHNPPKAKQLLDSIGLKDVNGDGWRELPDGSPLQITLDYHANATEDHVTKNELLAKDWQAVGINARPNPITPTAFATLWGSGQLQNYADWGVGNGSDCLTYPNWIVPLDNARWAPLQGQYLLLQGTPAGETQKDVNPWKRTPPRLEPEPGGPIEKLWNLYQQARLEPEFMKRVSLVWQIMKVHIQEGPFFSGTAANYPQLVLHKRDMRNVPTRDQLPLHGFTDPWTIPAPATYDPEAYYWQNPGAHTG